MCGINGTFSFDPLGSPVLAHDIEATRDRMTSRGPDHAGLWIDTTRRIGLGHRRLSIIDLSESGNQPMTTEDGRLTIVFNGEIYNFRALRAKLQQQGFRFRSKSDTEVLLHLYRAHGKDMVHHLRGMFAFAVWDAKEQQLFLARDHYGIKPLYYTSNSHEFTFASQLTALLPDRPGGFNVDPAGVVGYLLWGTVPEPLTLFREARLLPAGSILTIDRDGNQKLHRYWSIPECIGRSIEATQSSPADYDDAVHILRESLIDSVRHHMVADVPVGAFLSAGLDSATLVGLVREAGIAKLQSITLAFEEFKNSPLDELPAAQEIAKHFELQHDYRFFDLRNIQAELDAFTRAMDQPTYDGLNTWLVSRIARKMGLKVVLSGLGGDELLGGYNTFHRVPLEYEKWRRLTNRHPYLKLLHPLLPSLARHGLVGMDLPTLVGTAPGFTAAYQLTRGIFMPWELPALIDSDFLAEGLQRYTEIGLEQSLNEEIAELPDFGKLIALESSCYMRNQLLRDTDWTSMAHSLEIRVPLVDHMVTRKVSGLAALGRLQWSKQALPETLQHKLPRSITERPKTGFTLPTWRWLNNLQELSAWKRNPHLCSKHMRPAKRWVYCMLSNYLEINRVSSDFLR